MIVRDEEAHLADCLRSIRDLVDEIVVIDTGSSDGSRTLAESFGARVVPFEWRRDFAAARNEALSYARGSWILYVDADERARPCPRGDLEAVLGDPSAVAATVRFRPQTGYTRYREPRLFRNDPRIRFHGVIHETMLPAIHEVCRRDGTRIVPSELALDHVGYDGDQQRKHLRNLPLLRARLATDPQHSYSRIHLARTLAATGDEAGARAAWRQAIAIARARTGTTTLDCLAYTDLLCREPPEPDAATLLEEALQRFPGNHSLAWIHGRHLMATARFEAAIPIFEDLASIDGETLCDDLVAHDVRIFGVLAWDSLGLCHFRLGRYAESARWYARAEASLPGDLRYDVKRRLAEARAAGRGSRRPPTRLQAGELDT
jgi:tetratricopeptide (TPR) repeat protein